MYRILTEPVTNILRQQAELLSTEQVKLEFTEEAKREIARVASLANKTIENIGARRLHTVLEHVCMGWKIRSFSAAAAAETTAKQHPGT